jgi:chromosome segregation ATPase
MYAIKYGDVYLANVLYAGIKTSKTPKLFTSLKEAKDKLDSMVQSLNETIEYVTTRLEGFDKAIAKADATLTAARNKRLELIEKPYKLVVDKVKTIDSKIYNAERDLDIAKDRRADALRTIKRCQKALATGPHIVVMGDRPLDTTDAFEILKA